MTSTIIIYVICLSPGGSEPERHRQVEGASHHVDRAPGGGALRRAAGVALRPQHQHRAQGPAQ